VAVVAMVHYRMCNWARVGRFGVNMVRWFQARNTWSK